RRFQRQTAGPPYRPHWRRLSRNPQRQPHRRERARHVRIQRPLYRRRLRRFPARPAAAVDRAVRSGHRAVPVALVGSVSAGRLARARHADGERRHPLRIFLAAVRGCQSTGDARRRTRFQRGGAGGSGPFSGSFADTIVKPFRGGVAPRVGVAWRPRAGLVVRTGYGVNYSASVYQSIAQQLAGQPPFAVTSTVLASRLDPVPFESALVDVAPGVALNSYAVDPAYRPGVVQIWNVDMQRDLTRTLTIGAGYTGSKGSDLDIVRAPNRGPDGPLIPGVVPFLYESSSGDSILHAVTFRVRKRLADGFAAGASYTLSRSIDDASSIGGGAVVVAQNDRDLEAERGLSSFDQRHRFAGDFTFELPFGPNRRWFP